MKKMRVSEAEEQIAVVEYCEARGVPIYHVPNEGKRSKISGGILKLMGLRKGVPDLCIPLAKGGYFGLYIEMKVDSNKPTESQTLWLKLLKNNGYATALCYGFEEARSKIDKYIKLPDTVAKN